MHIEEFEASARDTKLGQEEITRDIPNVGEEGLRNLDEAGIVYIGDEVKAGDMLFGKVTPKGEAPMTPEEKLLRAIFGEKASDVRDTSLRLPPGVSGTIVEVRVFSRRGVDKDERALAIERAEIERLAKDRDDERSILERSFAARLKELMLGEIAVGGPRGMKSGTEITEAVLAEYAPAQWKQISIRDDARMADIEGLRKQMEDAVTGLTSRFESKVEKLRRGSAGASGKCSPTSSAVPPTGSCAVSSARCTGVRRTARSRLWRQAIWLISPVTSPTGFRSRARSSTARGRLISSRCSSGQVF